MLKKPAMLQVSDSMQVRVTVTDVRESFDRVDVLVVPDAGDGEDWVDSKRVTMVEVADEDTA